MDCCVGPRMGCLDFGVYLPRQQTFPRDKTMSQHLPVARLPQATEKDFVFILHISITTVTTELLLLKPITILRNVEFIY